ncbi:MAG: AAA family ATPase [archaeon]
MNVIITGTPGTGKTVLAKQLAKQLHLHYVSITAFVKQHKIYMKTDALDVDPAQLIPPLLKEMHKHNGCIVDGHLSHYLPRKEVSVCFVTKCPLPVLRERLAKRKYAEQKMRQNLDSEIFNVCYEEAKRKGHKPIVVWTE